jgi:hypothetical protein
MNKSFASVLALSSTLAIALAASVGLSACTFGVSTYMAPRSGYSCGYDYYGYYNCNNYYYNGDGTTETTRDVITNIAQTEQEMLANQAKHYATKFSLSDEQGLKIAKTINDFNAVQTRSDQDVADFAQRLYGVNPSQIVSAAGSAQAGDNSQLNLLVSEAAKNFNTTPDNMKKIVKSLHGKMLESQGIQL